MNPRRGGRLFVTAALAAALVLPGAAFAAGSDTHGGGHPTDTTGSLYSDLVVALRDADGTPILKEYYDPGDPNADPAVLPSTSFCVQPISYGLVSGAPRQLNPVDGRMVSVIPLQGEYIGDTAEEIEACDPQEEFAMFVTEAELERLNLTRTSESVLEKKIADVQAKLQAGDDITLDAAGRITVDGAALDASPEYAAIYASLMETGGIPGLGDDGALADISQTAIDPESNFGYGPFELAAVALGTAAGKYVPITVDTVQYYNRIVGFAEAAETGAGLPSWTGIEFIQAADPKPEDDSFDKPIDRKALPGSEWFVKYGNFSLNGDGGANAFTYNRADTFPGSITWLDVPNLTWETSRILDKVEFNDISTATDNAETEDVNERHDATLSGATAFAQMADDVRSVIVYLHENEVIPGFYMDPVGIDTTAEQEAAFTDPAVDLGGLPEQAFKTVPFSVTGSLYNPVGGLAIDNAGLRITVEPAGSMDALAPADVTLTAVEGSVSFAADGTGLVGWWGPESGFPMGKGYDVTTEFEAVFGENAPAGPYNVTLELVDVNSDTVLDEDFGSITVLENVATLTWGGDVPATATQGSTIPLPINVYVPGEASTTVVLTLTVAGPGTPALLAGNVKLFRDNGVTMTSMPLDLVAAEDAFTGTWSESVDPGDGDLTWYLKVVEGAPVGDYGVDIDIDAAEGTDLLGETIINVAAPEDHKSPNAPVIVEKEIVGDTATIVVSSPDKDVKYYEFVLVKDFTHLRLDESNDGSWTYRNLDPGAYKAKVTAIDNAGNRSETLNVLFEIADSSTGGGGGVITDPTTPADPGDGDPVVPPVDPEEPGDGAGEGGKPDTFIGNGPRSRSFVLGHSVTYRLRSNGDDVQYRVMLNNRFDQLCDSNVCVVDGLKSGKNVLRFAAQANGQRDDTPVVRKIYVPRNADGMRMTKRWTVRKNVRAFEGDLARTNLAGQVIRTRARDIRRIALVVAKGKGNGQVEVYLGHRLLTSTPIDLSNPTNQHQALVPVTTFRKLQTGFVRVKVVSQGKPVRIEGIGIVNR